MAVCTCVNPSNADICDVHGGADEGTPPPSREPGQADAALEADIAVFRTEMKRWKKPPRTAALTLRIIADRARDKERIVALEEALEHWGGDNKHMGISKVDPVTCPSCVKAQALLEVQDEA